jgi:hypothetical protein
MPGLRNQYVENLGKKICGKHFLGVYPSDIQPQLNTKIYKFSIIFNTEKHTQKGSHFIAIFADKYDFHYFDSYGEDCSNTDIKKFIIKNLKRREYSYNKKCIQDDKSLFCGFFCLSFILHRNKNISIKKYLENFSSNLLSNNNKVVKMITDEI